MYQQDVKGRKISPLAGVGMIALIVVSIMLAGFLEQLIAQLTGLGFGAMLVWALVAVEVFFLLRMGVREYRYTLTEGRLFIESRYGSSTRIIHDVAVASIRAIGPEDEIFAAYANGQTYDKVFVKDDETPASVIAYEKDEEMKLLLFQPDEKLVGLIKQQMSPGQGQ